MWGPTVPTTAPLSHRPLRAQCLWPWDVTDDIDATSIPIDDPRVAQYLGSAAAGRGQQPACSSQPAGSPMLQASSAPGLSALPSPAAGGLPPLDSPYGGAALPPLGSPPSCLAGVLPAEDGLPQLELPAAAPARTVPQGRSAMLSSGVSQQPSRGLGRSD